MVKSYNFVKTMNIPYGEMLLYIRGISENDLSMENKNSLD